MSRSIVAPKGHATTFVELFFDLIFVFCITQIVGLLHHDLTWVGVGHSILVFWLVWWAWTQFTWALNPADTTHPFVELGTLAATAIAFFMAVSIPESFSDRALGFAVTYVLVRSLGLWMYTQVARSNHPGQLAAVRLFAVVSTSGLIAVLAGGLLGRPAQTWLWGLAIGLDLVAALVAAGQKEWGIHAEHFAERHGLIVIVALGESLIVAAAGLAEGSFVGDVVGVAFLGVLVSCGLWWTYFPVVKPRLEHALAAAPGDVRGSMARDVYSLAHFPMLFGIVAYAVALEDAIAHPADPLPAAARLAMALGVLLFLSGTALAMWRATCGRPLPRLLVAALTAGTIGALATVPAVVSFAVALVGVVCVAVLDEVEARRLAR
ncbi:MAG: low temperature requirement protein A [Longimicrobiales bacterium]